MCSRVKMAADTLIQNAKREKKWHFVSKIVLAMKEKYSTDKEKRLKFETEGREFAIKFEINIQTVKDNNNF